VQASELGVKSLEYIFHEQNIIDNAFFAKTKNICKEKEKCTKRRKLWQFGIVTSLG